MLFTIFAGLEITNEKIWIFELSSFNSPQHSLNQEIPLAALNPLQGEFPTYIDVAPILKERCIICHNGPGAPKKLQLTGYKEILKGSENGPVAIPGDPDNSELIKRIKGLSLPRMPLTGPPFLSNKQILLMENWIKGGALQGIKKADSIAPKVKTEVKSTKNRFIVYSDIAPILLIKCVKCHSPKGLMGPPPEGLLLTSYQNILDSRDRARIIPGNPAASELVRRIRGQSLPRMPFDGPPYLNPEEIDLIVKWVQQGARDDNNIPASIPVGARVRLQGQLTDHWSLDGLKLKITKNTRIKKAPSVGNNVRVRGTVLPDGNIVIERIKRR